MKFQAIVKLLINLIFITLAAFPTTANSRKLESLKRNSSLTSNETKSESPSRDSDLEEGITDPLFILWVMMGIVGFLSLVFLLCYCLFKFSEGRENKETLQRNIPELSENKKIEVLQTLEEEGQVIEFLQKLERSSRKSLERNLGPPRKEDFGNGEYLNVTRRESGHFIPQNPDKYNDEDWFCVRPYSNSNTQRDQQGKTFFNYGFEVTEEKYDSEKEKLGDYRESDNRYCQRHHRSDKLQQTHRHLWYEDSFIHNNDIDVLPADKLEKTSRSSDERYQQQYYINDGHSNNVSHNSGSLNIDEQKTLPTSSLPSEIMQTVTVKSDFIEQDKSIVQDILTQEQSLVNEINLKQDSECNITSFQETEERSLSLKRGQDLEEFDDVESVVSNYGKRPRNIFPDNTYVANDEKIYRELLRGSIAALAFVNGSTDFKLNNTNIEPKQNEMLSKDSHFEFEREKKQSFKKPNDYGSLVNEQENMKRKKLKHHSVIKRITKTRRDSKLRLKNSAIGKQTRKFSKKVVGRLKKVKPQCNVPSPKQCPAFVIASL